MRCKLLANISSQALCCAESTGRRESERAHCPSCSSCPLHRPGLSTVSGLNQRTPGTEQHSPCLSFPAKRGKNQALNAALKSLITNLLVQLIHNILLDCKLFSAASADPKHHCYCCQAGENPPIQICVGTFAGSTYRHLRAFAKTLLI